MPGFKQLRRGGGENAAGGFRRRRLIGRQNGDDQHRKQHRRRQRHAELAGLILRFFHRTAGTASAVAARAARRLLNAVTREKCVARQRLDLAMRGRRQPEKSRQREKQVTKMPHANIDTVSARNVQSLCDLLRDMTAIQVALKTIAHDQTEVQPFVAFEFEMSILVGIAGLVPAVDLRHHGEGRPPLQPMIAQGGA